MDRLSRRSLVTGVGLSSGMAIAAPARARAVGSAGRKPVLIKFGSLPSGAPSRLPWASEADPRHIVVDRTSFPHGTARAVARLVAVSDGFVTVDADPFEAVHISYDGGRTSLGKIRDDYPDLQRETGTGAITRIARTGLDGIRVQTAATGVTVARLVPGNWFTVAGFHRDQVWFSTEDRTTRVWRVGSDEVRVFDPLQLVDVRPAAGVLVTYDSEAHAYRVKPFGANDFRPFAISGRRWYTVRISPNGRWIAATRDRTLRIYSVATGQPVHDLGGRLGTVEWESGDHIMTSVLDPIPERRVLVRIDARSGAFNQASPIQNAPGVVLARH